MDLPGQEDPRAFHLLCQDVRGFKGRECDVVADYPVKFTDSNLRRDRPYPRTKSKSWDSSLKRELASLKTNSYFPPGPWLLPFVTPPPGFPLPCRYAPTYSLAPLPARARGINVV